MCLYPAFWNTKLSAALRSSGRLRAVKGEKRLNTYMDILQNSDISIAFEPLGLMETEFWVTKTQLLVCLWELHILASLCPEETPYVSSGS